MDSPDAELMARARQRLGTVVRGKYRLERVLGIGGMGTVYEARHRNGARFALKLLHPELSTRESVRKRFQLEGYSANAVGRGSVRVVDDDVTEDGAAFLVMDLLVGASVETIAARARGTGELSVAIAAAIVSATLDTLEAAHAQRIVHRDIKPANLFVTTEGVVRVLDFGIARALDGAAGQSQKTGSGMPLGTPSFMAPEQALGKIEDIDARTDVWAAGATMFTLLSGRVVHDADTAAGTLVKAATERAPSLSSVAAGVAPAVAAVVDRALAFDREARWASAGDMKQALEEALASATLRPALAADLARLALPEASVESTRMDPFGPTRPIEAAAVPASDTVVTPFEPGPSTTTAPASGTKRAATPSRRSRGWLLFAVVPLALAAAIGILYVRKPASTPSASVPAGAAKPLVATPGRPIPVLLLGFDIEVNEPLFESTLDGILAASLEASSVLDPYYGPRLSDLAQAKTHGDRAELAHALAEEGGKVIAVRGTANVEGRGYVLSIRALDGGGSTVVAARRTASDLGRVVVALSQLARDLRAAVGDSATDPELGDKSGVSDSLEADHEWALGCKLLHNGAGPASIAALERATALDPGFNVAHSALGYVYYNMGRFADAARQFDLADRPGAVAHRTRLSMRGDRASMVGDYGTAVPAFEELTATWPEDETAAIDLTETLVLARQPARALELGLRLAGSHPTDLTAQHNASVYMLLAGDARGAAIQAKKVLTEFPHVSASTSIMLGTATALLGESAEARAAYQSVEPERPALASYALADLALYEGRLQDATVAAERCAELERSGHGEGQAGHVWGLLAEVDLLRGRKALAIAAADKASASTEPWAHYAAGVTFAGAGEDNKLALLASSTHTFGPDAALVAKLLGALVLRSQHKLAGSVTALEEARTLADSWVVHLELARSYLALGDRSAARKELDACVARRGEGALAYVTNDTPTLRYVAQATTLLAQLGKEP
jgi:eukaryotic-like serine/threonine-protein kinase